MVINKDASSKVLIKLKPIEMLRIKKISKKTVTNLANFLGKNNEDNIYTTNRIKISIKRIFHQTSGGVR